MIYANPIEMPLVEQVVEVANERQDGILLSTADKLLQFFNFSGKSWDAVYLLKGLVGIIPERVQVKLWNRMMKKPLKI